MSGSSINLQINSLLPSLKSRIIHNMNTLHKFLPMLISQLESMPDNIFMHKHLESRQKVFLKLT